MARKEQIKRGTKRRFEIYITDLAGNAQDPDSCYVFFEKEGSYGYDSPSPRYTCSKTGAVGYWGADIPINNSMTLGDWIANFNWYTAAEGWNSQQINFVIIETRRPYINQDHNTIAPNKKVVE